MAYHSEGGGSAASASATYDIEKSRGCPDSCCCKIGSCLFRNRIREAVLNIKARCCADTYSGYSERILMNLVYYSKVSLAVKCDECLLYSR